MPASNHIKAIFRAFANRDDAAFKMAADELIAEERQRGHGLLADDLRRALNNGSSLSSLPNDVPLDKERGLPLVHVERPQFDWVRVVLSNDLRAALGQVVDEFRKRSVLASFGIHPKRKLLFFGPPGCGKTITARVMAGVLDLPLLYVRFDSVVSSYLGETAANLRRVFDYAERGNWLVLFDEFDAIGKERDNPFEHGELKRVVNTLLQLMDGFSGDSLLVAATNHHYLLDQAIWRRFDEVCHFGLPRWVERQTLLRNFLGAFHHPSINIRESTRRMAGMTGDDIERIVLDAVKSAILGNRREISPDDMTLGLERQRRRIKLAGGEPPTQKASETRHGKKPGAP
jgi:SpoVK/Ycf46/Vps4 family AAA+-type ATPase